MSIAVAEIQTGAAARWKNRADNLDVVRIEYSSIFFHVVFLDRKVQMNLSSRVVRWNKAAFAFAFFAICRAAALEKQQSISVTNVQGAHSVIGEQRLATEQSTVELF